MAKKKPPEADQHKEKPLFLRLPGTYQKAIREVAEESRRTITAEVKIALEEYLTKKGKTLG